MPFDFKKEYKDLYLPQKQPGLIEVPEIQYVAVAGAGDPNAPDGEYAAATGVLYSISYTIKMSYMGARPIEGYFPYVVPPLEGLWWTGMGGPPMDFQDKSDFRWISMIRLPSFVTEEVFAWAREEAARKKKIDTGRARLLTLTEGLCVQCMHTGPYDEEPATIARMQAYLEAHGYVTDHSDVRRHHEIYLGDPRKTAPEKLKTVIRLPVRER